MFAIWKDEGMYRVMSALIATFSLTTDTGLIVMNKALFSSQKSCGACLRGILISRSRKVSRIISAVPDGMASELHRVTIGFFLWASSKRNNARLGRYSILYYFFTSTNILHNRHHRIHLISLVFEREKLSQNEWILSSIVELAW